MSEYVQLTRTDLQARRSDLVQKLAAVSADIEGIKAELATKLTDLESAAQKFRSSLGQIDVELSRREAMDSIVPTISDHALLRYIERVCGVDVEKLKAELLTDAVVTAIKAGASAVRFPYGTMVIKGSTVVTILDPEMRAKRKIKRGLVEADLDDFEEEEDSAA